MNGIVAFLKDENGASPVEYALMLAVVVSGLALAVFGLRDGAGGMAANARP